MADNNEIIQCPACGEKMVKVFMPSQGVNLDVCVNGCGGIYFDNREFSKFDAPHDDITPLMDVLKNKQFNKIDEAKIRKCPVCKANMVKNYASPKHEIQVDECYSCGGKFLDYQELDKIRTQYTTEEDRAADVMKQLYSDLGIEQPSFKKMNKQWMKGVFCGFIFGIIIAGIFLYKSNSIIALSSNKTAAASSIAIAAGICLISAGIGALFSKPGKE